MGSALLMSVCAGPLDIESRAEKGNPALTVLIRQANAPDIDYDSLNVVWHETKHESPVVLHSIAGSSVAVSRLADRRDTHIPASVHGSVDLAVRMAAEDHRMGDALEVVCQDRIRHVRVKIGDP